MVYSSRFRATIKPTPRIGMLKSVESIIGEVQLLNVISIGRRGTWTESIQKSLGPTCEAQELASIRPTQMLPTTPSTDLHADWLKSLEVYSTRSMTKPNDRLPAIAGYAHELHKVLHGTYLAGTWEEHFASGLPWVVHREAGGSPVPKAAQKRETSWS